ncbi:unnamed protein product [Effrenium voratum]|uniref:Uncharacterized protein n=1 Tax=Effrenium voratum TaxID=2562239 RepID=A0AA36HNR0_9DINO|nr:unnamed protein product [Effrenium voratum]CAJ1372536.1 unnamed protein product [Effrenium voratum]CAJ1453990.1 unnamed protein product [Effrenium voratum]
MAAALSGTAAGPAVLRPKTIFPSARRRRLEARDESQVKEALGLANRFMLYPSQRHLGGEPGLALSLDRGRICVKEKVCEALAARTAIDDLPRDHLEWARR